MSDEEAFPISLDVIRKAESHSRRKVLLTRHFSDAVNERWEDLNRACNATDESTFSPSKEQYVSDSAHSYVAAVEDAAVIKGFVTAWTGLEEAIGSTSVGRVLRLAYEVAKATELIEKRSMMDGLSD